MMVNESSNIAMLDCLEEHEQALCDLYAEFARCCPEHRQFWEQISSEEYQHARWVKALKVKVLEDDLLTHEHTVKIPVIEAAIRFIRSQIDKARKNELTPMNAFSIAMSLEEGTLEKKFFTVFAPDDAKYKKALQVIIRATNKHRNLMAAHFQQLKERQKTP